MGREERKRSGEVKWRDQKACGAKSVKRRKKGVSTVVFKHMSVVNNCDPMPVSFFQMGTIGSLKQNIWISASPVLVDDVPDVIATPHATDSGDQSHGGAGIARPVGLPRLLYPISDALPPRERARERRDSFHAPRWPIHNTKISTASFLHQEFTTCDSIHPVVTGTGY
ncbi:uncharacterized protein LOC134217088 [Armigeres subalbatus]|uniref:uncharacterized protein LOC134217088 n=1 Tax=Armigeres subalbatus TaxID=124917 RepID=UPI002ED53F2A